LFNLQADIIYHLFDAFEAYLKKMKEEEQEAAKERAVFPCVLQILPEHIFNNKDPIIVGVEVLEGVARVGTLVRASIGPSTMTRTLFTSSVLLCSLAI
jgi:translation initiation factor IF-2